MDASSTNLLPTYELLISQFNSLVTLLSFFATAFGVIVAVVIAFFTIRQINVDREIRAYKKDISRQRDSAIQEVEKIKKELTDLGDWADVKKKEIEKLEQTSGKENSKELLKIRTEIERLKEDVAFKQGAISTGPTGPTVFTSVLGGYQGYAGGGGGGSAWPLGSQKCNNCGRAYSKNYNLEDWSITGSRTSKCPYCGNVN